MEILFVRVDILPLLDARDDLLLETTLDRPTGVEMLKRPNCEFRGFTELIDIVDILPPSAPVTATECFLDSDFLKLPGGESETPDADEPRRLSHLLLRILICAMPATVSAGPPAEDRDTLLNAESLGAGDTERDMLAINQ